jgi:hypothetical protein
MSAPSAKITEFRLGKGRTDKVGEMDFVKKYLEITVLLPDQHTEKQLQDAILQTEYLIDNYLGAPEGPQGSQVPEFDTGLLMNHAWKGKKVGESAWDKGSVAWGWDFTDQFPPEVVKVLEKGPVTLDKYEFSINETGAIVNAKEKKEKRGRQK